jgi:hypothetical protein
LEKSLLVDGVRVVGVLRPVVVEEAGVWAFVVVGRTTGLGRGGGGGLGVLEDTFVITLSCKRNQGFWLVTFDLGNFPDLVVYSFDKKRESLS